MIGYDSMGSEEVWAHDTPFHSDFRVVVDSSSLLRGPASSDSVSTLLDDDCGR